MAETSYLLWQHTSGRNKLAQPGTENSVKQTINTGIKEVTYRQNRVCTYEGGFAVSICFPSKMVFADGSVKRKY